LQALPRWGVARKLHTCDRGGFTAGGWTRVRENFLHAGRGDRRFACRVRVPGGGEAGRGGQGVRLGSDSCPRPPTWSFEKVFLYGFVLVALLAGGTLISNTFTVTIAQRARELALARALGATARQVLTAVLAETAFVGVVASIVGTALGVGIAALIRSVFSLLNLTLFDTRAVISLSSLALPAVVGLAVTVFTAVKVKALVQPVPASPAATVAS
jgi:FtsX-like permease family